MQGVLTSREAWTRFACELLSTTDLSHTKIASEADQMLQHYLARFPDPPNVTSARLTHDSLEFVEPYGDLTEGESSPGSGDP